MGEKINIAVIFIIIVLMGGCATSVTKIESTERYVKKLGKDPKDPVIEFKVKENKDGSFKGILTSPFIHWGEFTGETVIHDNQDIEFYIERFEYLDKWPNGWTEGIHEASGIILFQKQGDNWEAIVREEIEIWDIVKGEIRYFNDYYRDNKGLGKVKNRMERIRALNDFIKESGFPEYFGSLKKETPSGLEFIKTIKNFLFDKSTVYPDTLQNIKESGTVMRDFEEASGLMYMEYNMEYFLKKVLPDSAFKG
jgi:hypothetical protein